MSFISHASGEATTINTANIITNTVAAIPNCLHYKIKGLCFWLRCTGPICWVETTLKLDHYLPDAVVSVFNHNNPWLYAKEVLDPPAEEIGKQQMQLAAGTSSVSSGDEHVQSYGGIGNKFKEVDVIGNPALTLFKGYKLFLPSTATPYKPYYLSLLDMYAWRYPGLEQLYLGYYTPGLHEVGTFLLHDWGPVYPRNGFLAQPDDAKAAAVMALRATHIVTRTNQPHLYTDLSDSCGSHCTAAPVTENSKDSEYQMIYPLADDHCIVFGQSDITSLQPWGMAAYRAGQGNYVWVLWRHYQGCVPDHGAHYLGSMNF